MSRLLITSKFLISLVCLSSILGLELMPGQLIASSQTSKNYGERFRSRIRLSKKKLPGNIVPRGSRTGDEGNLCGKFDAKMPTLTAIVPAISKPKNERGSHKHYTLGLTTQEKPTFWFYLPYRIAKTRSAQFELYLDDQLVSEEDSVTLPTQPGLYGLQLKKASLQLGKTYSWKFQVTCIAGDPSANDDVTGWIERVDSAEVSELQRRLKTAKSPLQKFEAYAEQGLWHDSMTLLTGEVCRQNLKRAQQEFNELLQGVDLKSFSTRLPDSLLTTCDPPSK